MAELKTVNGRALVATTAILAVAVVAVAALLTGHDYNIFLLAVTVIVAITAYIAGRGGRESLAKALNGVRAVLLEWLVDDAGPEALDTLRDYLEVFEHAWPEFADVIRKALKRLEESVIFES